MLLTAVLAQAYRQRMGRRKDGLCSACKLPHTRNSGLCGKCAWARDKARANGHAPTRAMQAAVRETKKAVFLRALLDNGGHVEQACRTAKTTRPTVGDWRDADPEFAAEWESIQEHNVELLEREADRRAFRGYETVTRDEKGAVVKTVSGYSDNLLMFRLKALRPEKYRDGPRAATLGSGLTEAELDAELQRMIARRTKRDSPPDVSDAIN
jgi:hypothetical protein